MKIDALSRPLLAHVVSHPDDPREAVALAVEARPHVVSERLQRLRDEQIIQGATMQVDMAELGYPHEAFVWATPTSQTSRHALETLVAEPFVTRVFTMAAHHSIGFCVRGAAAEDVEAHARALASRAHLTNVSCVMLIDTLLDDPAKNLTSALGGKLTIAT